MKQRFPPPPSVPESACLLNITVLGVRRRHAEINDGDVFSYTLRLCVCKRVPAFVLYTGEDRGNRMFQNCHLVAQTSSSPKGRNQVKKFVHVSTEIYFQKNYLRRLSFHITNKMAK